MSAIVSELKVKELSYIADWLFSKQIFIDRKAGR